MRALLFWRKSLVFLTLLAGLAGCNSMESMTGDQIGCDARDIVVMDSEVKRSGSKTTWCARCSGGGINAGKNYVCATNPSQDRVECREVPLGPPCQ